MVPKFGYIRKAVAAARGGITTTVEFDLFTLPGGVDAFDKAARYCYRANFQLSVRNAAALLCASAFLDMQPPLARWPEALQRAPGRGGRAGCPGCGGTAGASAPASRGEGGEAARQPPGPLPTRGCLAPLRPWRGGGGLPASSGLARRRRPSAGEEGEAARRRCDHGGFGRRAAGNGERGLKTEAAGGPAQRTVRLDFNAPDRSNVTPCHAITMSLNPNPEERGEGNQRSLGVDVARERRESEEKQYSGFGRKQFSACNHLQESRRIPLHLSTQYNHGIS
ncbi:hypothetical protein OsJ_17472 [Oryza sativa Japonica Group]|uniref:Uncharacterized protein n=1 Tax=Oryza sativa subsp. japonica TaxID=39947 RepID=B9FMZ7_ORYSJ|nr:hypothetical protein OsJ_17472 [Oryza sativa Japonica Group]